MKLCRTCNTEKEIISFHKRTASPDGLCPKCKACSSSYDKARANNQNRVDARKAYAETDEGKESTARAKKKWAANNKGKIYEITKSYREKNPLKYKAHGKVAYAIKMGDLVSKPCEKCNAMPTHAHHDNYREALNVRWLCSKCHTNWHKENGEGLNA